MPPTQRSKKARLSEDERRTIVDEFFDSTGPLIASRIAGVGKLADLFRSDGVPQAIVQEGMDRLVQRLLGSREEQGPRPLWIAIQLTGGLKSDPELLERVLERVAMRFFYRDCDGAHSAGKLWDKLIDDQAVLRKHFEERLSLSKLYDTGLLPPSVRRVHLVRAGLVVESIKKQEEGLGDGKAGIAVSLWDESKNENEQASGLFHSLDASDRRKLVEYLKFIFAQDKGIHLYTAVPIISEHNILKRSIGEVFIAEGESILDASAREDLIRGLCDVARGLAARFFVLDQEELIESQEDLKHSQTKLTEENARVKKYEERMNFLDAPLRTLADALEEVRTDTQKIHLAVHEPSDGLFRYHRELSVFFWKGRHIELGTPGVKWGVTVEHEPECYDTEESAGVILCLAVGRILAFESELLSLPNAKAIFDKTKAMVDDAVRQDSLKLMGMHVFDDMGFVAVLPKKSKALLENLKLVVHLPYKPDAEYWPLRPVLLACRSSADHTFAAEYSEHSKEMNVSTWENDAVKPLRLNDISKVTPYSLNAILAFIIQLRTSYEDKSCRDPITAVAVRDRSDAGRLVSLKLTLTSQNAHEGKRVTDVVNRVRQRVNNKTISDFKVSTGDAVLPFVSLASAQNAWKLLRASGLARVVTGLSLGSEGYSANDIVFGLAGDERLFLCAYSSKSSAGDGTVVSVGLFWLPMPVPTA